MEKSTEKEMIILRDICPNSGSLDLLESIETPKGDYTGVVLASLDGPVMDYKIPTRNERLYEEELCDEIAESDYVSELIETKNFLGEPDHPMRYENRLDIHYPNVSHAIRNLRKVPEKGCYYATFDILDTPNGRILKTLIDYGTKLGVSSRGSGRTITKMGRVVVDKSTYRFITFDIVCMPGNKVARLPNTTNESVEISSSQTLTEQVDQFIKSDDLDSLRQIKPVLAFLSESNEIKDLIDQVDAKLSTEENTTSVESATADLVEAYKIIKNLKNELSQKDSIINEQNLELQKLRESTSELQSTSSELEKKLSKSTELMMSQLQKEQASRRSISSLKAELEDIKKHKEKLEDTVMSLREGIAQKDSQIKKLSENVGSVSDAKNKEIESLQRDIKKKSGELDSITEQLSFSEKKYDELASKYFSTRCSQLGLDESLVRKSISEGFSSYDYRDLESILQEAYKRKPKYSQNGSSLFESLNRSARIGGTVVTANKSNSTGDADPMMDALTESCRAVKNNN